jgi:hypothetical protein
MHCSPNADLRPPPARSRKWLIACSLALAAFEPAVCAPLKVEPGFTVRSADLRLESGVYFLDAKIVFEFSAEAIEAMDNGVTLSVLIDVEVFRQRTLWDRKILSRRSRINIGVHALSRKYVMKKLDTGEIQAYGSVEEMAAVLGNIERLPLFEAADIDTESQYAARVRARLDIEALPSPLRPLAYVSQAWRLGSDWYELPLVQ